MESQIPLRDRGVFPCVVRTKAKQVGSNKRTDVASGCGCLRDYALFRKELLN